MRIGVDARPLLHPKTGIGRYTHEILRRITASPHSFFLYSDRALTGDLLTRPNVTLRHGGFGISQAASLSAQFNYPRWATADRLDVFWSPRHHLPLLTSVPCIVTIHDMAWRREPESMITFGRLLERLLMPPSIRRAKAIIAVSEATRLDLLRFNPSAATKTTVIHEAAFSTPARRQDAGTVTQMVLAVGTHEPRKNYERLLRAYALLRRSSNIRHRLIIAGHPGWKVDLPGLVRQLSLSNWVELVQPTDNELRHLYATCDFLAHPALYEGFGLPIVEAMAFGKPVITSNVAAMPEVAGDAALLVDPYDVASLAIAMQRLIQDRPLRERLAAKAMSQSRKFSWDKAAAETLAVIESAGRGGGA